MKRIWNWSSLAFLFPLGSMIFLLHVIFAETELIPQVILGVFILAFGGVSLAIWLHMPLCYTFDSRSVRIRYLPGVEELPWNTVWKVEQVDLGRGGRCIRLYGTPVGKKRFFYHSMLPDTQAIRDLVGEYQQMVPAPVRQVSQVSRPQVRKKVAVNLHSRGFLSVGLLMLAGSIFYLLGGVYDAGGVMLVFGLVCLCVAVAIPSSVVFDGEGLQVRYGLGFYESFTWEQLQWLEPCMNDEGEYWLPHLKGPTTGRKAFFTHFRIPINRKVKALMEQYWQQAEPME